MPNNSWFFGPIFGIGADKGDVRVKIVWPFALKHKNGGHSLKIVDYNLSKYNYARHLDVTLVEDGKVIVNHKF